MRPIITGLNPVGSHLVKVKVRYNIIMKNKEKLAKELASLIRAGRIMIPKLKLEIDKPKDDWALALGYAVMRVSYDG